MVMSRRRMHQKDAIILAGLLGGVLLLLFSPLWGPMIWRAPASFSEPVAVSGQATKKEEKKDYNSYYYNSCRCIGGKLCGWLCFLCEKP